MILAAEFLDQKVSRRLRYAEQAVRRLVDAHVLRDALGEIRMRGIDLVPGLKLLQRQRVGAITIDLVRR